MARQRRLPPYRGAGNNAPYISTPGDLCSPADLDNFRTYRASKTRPQGGQRPSLRALFPVQMGGGRRVQALGVVSRAAGVSGYTLGASTPMTGSSRVSGALHGNLFVLDNDPALFQNVTLDAVALGYSAGYDAGDTKTVQSAAFHPDGDRYAVAHNYLDAASGHTRFALQLRSLSGGGGAGAALWSASIADPMRDRFVDAVLFWRDLLIVASNEFILVHRVSDGVIQQIVSLGSARQIKALCALADGSLVAAFDGSDTGNTLPSAVTVDAGVAAVQFRSGLARFVVGFDAPIAQIPYGPQLAHSATYFESAHNTWRVSEQSGAAPRGCQVYAVAACPDGGCVFVRTNQGIGPNTAFPPDGSTPYISVAKVAAGGTLAWEVDTDSLREAMTYNATTYYNDIHFASGDPTLLGIDVDAAGDLYIGGRQNGGGLSALKLSGTDGTVLWGANLQATGAAAIRQGCVRVDPRDNCPVFAGDRNTAWDGAAGQNAMLWKLSALDGSVLWHLDLGAAVSGTALAINSTGQIVLGTDRF